MLCDEDLKTILVRHFCELMAFGNNEDEYEEDPALAKQFFTALNEPVDNKTAKYAKAVARILTGEQATLYFAIEYRDAASLVASDAFREYVPHFKESVRGWQTMRTMAQLCFLIQGVEPPRVPGRAEIEANISQFRMLKRTKSVATGSGVGSGSMQRAFFEKVLETASILPTNVGVVCRERIHAIPREEHASLCVQWSENPFTTRDSDFGGTVYTADERDAFRSLDGGKWSQAEQSFRQLNDLSRVQQQIPSSMLGTIENYATELAAKISSGEADLSSIDLQSIGEDVLKQCSEDDMSQLANNIGQLLPALGSLQQTVQSQAGVHGQKLPNLAALGALLPRDGV